MPEFIPENIKPPIKIHTDFHFKGAELEKMRTTKVPKGSGQGTVLENLGAKSEREKPFQAGKYRWGLQTVVNVLSQQGLTPDDIQDIVDEKVEWYHQADPGEKILLTLRIKRDLERLNDPRKIHEIPIPRHHPPRPEK